MVSPSNDFDLEVLPGDTDMLVLDSGGLVSIVRRREIFAKVKGSVSFIAFFQVTAVYRGSSRSLLGLIYASRVPRELTRKLVEGVFCLLDVNMGSGVDLEDFEVFMVGRRLRGRYPRVHVG